MNGRIFKSDFSSSEELITLRIARWVLVRKEFSNSCLNDILINWESWMRCGLIKVRRTIHRSPLLIGVFKFNFDGVAKGKLGLVEI